MQYRFYLDRQLITENPEGWDTMTIKAFRDAELKGVFVNLNATITFTADGYNYLNAIRQANDNYCDEVALSIHVSTDGGQNFRERHRGLTFLSDMKFDEFKCRVEVPVTDDSFFGRINARKNNEAFLTGVKTVNGFDITPPTLYAMQLFDPATGLDVPTLQTRGAFRAGEALQYLVGFMTDNNVEFESPLFGPGGDFANLMLTNGYSIRQTGNANVLTMDAFIEHLPGIAFKKLFTELDHRFNIGFYVDRSGSKPKIIVDYWKELFRNATSTTFADLPNLKTEYAKELIYSQAHFGGSRTFDAVAASFPETIRFLGFNDEKFIITGKCNVDNTLDLTYDFVSSSNVIQQILILSGTDDQYDKDWFLIDADIDGSTLVARKSNWLNPGATIQYYNGRLTNIEIAKRYIGFIPNSIAAYLGDGNDDFLATSTADFTVDSSASNTYTVVPFQDDSTLPNFDAGGNFSTVLFDYTAPSSGVYNFFTRGRLRFNYLAGDPISVGAIVITRYNAALTVELGRETIFYKLRQTVLPNNVENFDGSWTTNLATGERVLVELYVFFNSTLVSNSWSVLAGAEFGCDNVVNGGGVYQTYDPADYPVLLSIFKTEIKDSQTNAIIQNPLSKIGFYIFPDDPRLAWIQDLTIDEFRGTVDAKLLTSRRGTGVEFPPDIRYVTVIGQLPDLPFSITNDRYGNPTGGNDTIAKVFFFEAGRDITITIPSTYMGCPVTPGQNIYVTEYPSGGGAFIPTAFPTTTATFRINPLCNYIVQLSYDLSQPGNTFPSVSAEVVPPDVAGNVGTANIRLVSPTDPADYSFAWTGPGLSETTQGITAPAGLYECVVTYLPGTFDTNVMTFHVEIPISRTGA